MDHITLGLLSISYVSSAAVPFSRTSDVYAVVVGAGLRAVELTWAL